MIAQPPWRVLWIALAAALAVLYFSAAVSSFHKRNVAKLRRSATLRDTDSGSSAAENDESMPTLRIWGPSLRSCRGRFVTHRLNNLTLDSPPVLMLREAAVDMRHSSLKEIGARQIVPVPFRRIVVHVSAARDVVPSLPEKSGERGAAGHPFPEVSISGGDEMRKKGWKAKLNYIISDAGLSCQNKGIKVPRYKHLSWVGGEWQLIMTLTGPQHLVSDEEFQEALEGLIQSATLSNPPIFELDLPVRLPRADNFTKFHLSMGLTCVAGLLGKNTLQHRLPFMPTRTACSEASGSVVVAGGAMFGEKRNSAAGRKEAASFAARSLLGSIRFDTVAIPVMAGHSVTKILGLCNGDGECMDGMFAENEKFTSTLALEVEGELKALGVPESMWARVVLFPVCKLGTDYDGHEKGDLACDWSAYMGQRMVNELGYTLFSPYHKWYASFDLDEFAVDEASYLASPPTPQRRVPQPQSATALFDRRDAASRGVDLQTEGRLFLGWLDFKLTVTQLHNASLAVLRNGGLEFKAFRAQSDGTRALNRSSCKIQGEYKRGRGKVAVSCANSGFGTHVHDSLGLRDPLDLASRFCDTPRVYDADIFVYHGTRTPRLGNCEWKEEDRISA